MPDNKPSDRRGPRATRPLAPRIALVFDFDDTLAHDSFDLLFEQLDQDPDHLKHERMERLYEDGWEEAMAHIHVLGELDRTGEAVVDREALQRAGREATLMPGLEGMFERVRSAAHEADEDLEGERDGAPLEVEFYVLSAGLGDVIRASPVASEFDGIWACEVHYRDGRVRGAKQVVTHSEKARYLLQLSRGLEPVRGNPPDPYIDVPEEDLHVPLSQIVFVGDGASDMPAFALMQERGGVAIGVYSADEAADWDAIEKVQRSRRVDNIAPADYREGSELMRSLELAVSSVARRVALRRLGAGE